MEGNRDGRGKEKEIEWEGKKMQEGRKEGAFKGNRKGNRRKEKKEYIGRE